MSPPLGLTRQVATALAKGSFRGVSGVSGNPLWVDPALELSY